MGRASILLVGLALVLPISTAGAEDSARYALEKTPDGYVRLDRQTGAIEMCRDSAGQLTCRAAVDQGKATQDEIDRLNGRIDRLEQRIASLEKANKPVVTLPSDADLDRTMNVMERFFRRFMGIVKDFNQEQNGGQDQPNSDKT